MRITVTSMRYVAILLDHSTVPVTGDILVVDLFLTAVS